MRRTMVGVVAATALSLAAGSGTSAQGDGGY